MSPSRLRQLLWAFATVCGMLPWKSNAVFAQGTGGLVVADSKVGYIDDAIPGDLLRFRYDAAFNSNRPSRGEFFYAPTVPRGPGLPLPETRVDYQDISALAEVLLLPGLSAFLEIPVRFLNPEVNANTAGLADLNAGFKYAFLKEETQVLTFQLRTYVPSGDAHHGLGTAHVSLEPGLLFMQKWDDRLRLEGELRYWVPVGGDTFAGSLVRYGLGVSYDLFEMEQFRITPVAELVGWTLLGGKESVIPAPGSSAVQNAAGDTIVNAKLGLRLAIGENMEVYGGGGRALTGERWYENTYRLEVRLHY